MQLSLMPYNQTTSISPEFKAHTFNPTFIKNIQNTPCACCGKKVLIQAQFNRSVNAISKSLSTALNQGLLDPWKKNKFVWDILQKLADENPRQPLEKIIQKKENYEMVSSALLKVAQNQKDTSFDDFSNLKLVFIKNIIKLSRSKLKCSETVMKKLAPLKSYLDGLSLQTFEQFEIYSHKYPRKTLAEIIRLPEVIEYHKTKENLQIVEIKDKIDFRFANVFNIVKKANPEAVKNFDKLKEEALKIYSKTSDPIIRLAKIQELYAQVLKEHNCEKLSKKVNKEFEQMPISYLTVDSFFVHAHKNNYNDIDVINSLFSQPKSTFEHIIPVSEKRIDTMGNGLVMHRKCNIYRGNMPYQEFWKYHPEMPHNIQKQVKFLSEAILNDKLHISYKYWPLNLLRTFRQYTNSAIKIDNKSYYVKTLKKTEQKIEELNALINKLLNNKNKIIWENFQIKKEERNSISRELENIDAQVRGLRKQSKAEIRFLEILKSNIKKLTKEESMSKNK